MKPEFHVFVCAQQRPPGHPRGSCAEKGAGPVLQVLSKNIMGKNLQGKVSIITTGCLGPCDQGVNLLVFPGAHMYTNMTPADIDSMVDRHLIGGDILTEKLLPEMA